MRPALLNSGFENAVKPVEGAPAGDYSEARLRAEACLAAAKDEGIAREDIEEETGDLANYMGAAIANLVNHPDLAAQSGNNPTTPRAAQTRTPSKGASAGRSRA